MIYKGNWIYYHTGEKKRPDSLHGNPSPYFRKCFGVKDGVESAYLYASAMGCFKAFLNGEAVSDDLLSPGRCDYSNRLPLVKYDITEKIIDKNAVGIVCGDGWAVGAVPFGSSYRRNCYSDEIYLYAVIEINYENGEKEYVYTDKSWKASDGKIRYSGIYTGECVDNRVEIADFSGFEFDDSEWKTVSVDSYPKNYLLYIADAPCIRHKDVIKPVRTESGHEGLFYDFGRPVCGSMRFTVSGKSGDSITVAYSDSESEPFDTDKADVFILSGNGDEYFETLFSVHRFRYACVFGSDKPENVSAVEIISDIERTGDFYCSDTRINEKYVNATRAMRRRFLSIPEEENGYGCADGYNTLFDMYTFSADKVYTKFFEDINDAQSANGFIPADIPVPQFGYKRLVCGDTDSFISVLKTICNYYVMNGDASVVKKHLQMCKLLADYIYEHCGDKLKLGTTAFYMMNLCGIVRDADTEGYKEKYNSLKLEFRSELKDGETSDNLCEEYINGYEIGYFLADEIKKVIMKSRGIEERYPELIGILCDIGQRDEAYNIVCTHPDVFAKTPALSWLYSGMLGIKPEAGFKKVKIEPAIDLSDRIKKAGGSCMTPFGKLSVFWEKTDDTYTCCLTVPFEIDAVCRFPGFKVINQKCSRETYVFVMRRISG